MPSPRTRFLVLATALPVLAPACGEPMSSRDVIEDTRPIALRIEVEDPGASAEDATRCEALPLERAVLQPLIVDEEGPLDSAELTALEPVWISCNMQPTQGLFGCLSEHLPLGLADLPACESPDPSDLDLDPADPPDSPSPCRIVEGVPHRPELVVPLDFDYLLGGDIEITMIAGDPEGTDTSTCADRLLSQDDDLPGDCLFMVQRLPVGPDAALIQLAGEFGFDLGDLGVVPEEIPDPDTNPRIARFQGAFVDDDGERGPLFDIGLGETIDVGYGEVLALETEAPEADQQTYLIPEDNDAFQEQTEIYDSQWFRNWGTLVAAGTNDLVSPNEWIMEPDTQDDDEPPPGDRATLYYVLRDDRAGVDWWWFHVRLTGEPDF